MTPEQITLIILAPAVLILLGYVMFFSEKVDYGAKAKLVRSSSSGQFRLPVKSPGQVYLVTTWKLWVPAGKMKFRSDLLETRQYSEQSEVRAAIGRFFENRNGKKIAILTSNEEELELAEKLAIDFGQYREGFALKVTLDPPRVKSLLD